MNLDTTSVWHYTDSGYDGLMCQRGDRCTQRSSATTAELDASAAYFQARPIPASSISVSARTSTTVTITFSGHGNADQLVPAYSPYLQNWSERSAIGPSNTTYQFTGLTPNTTYNFRIISRKSGQPDGSSQWVTATTQPIGRVQGFKIDASSSSRMSLSWTALEGATSYERCVSNGPNTGSWICSNVGNITSETPSIPSTSSKGVWYYAIRGVDANGQKGAFSNRGTISRFNETVSGTAYNSYHTAYKTSSGTKKVNGFNRHSSASRYLAFSNGTSYKKGLVSASSKWFSSASSWSAADESTPYGPVIRAIESPNSSLSPRDEIAHSTVCMVISGGCE